MQARFGTEAERAYFFTPGINIVQLIIFNAHVTLYSIKVENETLPGPFQKPYVNDKYVLDAEAQSIIEMYQRNEAKVDNNSLGILCF